MRKKEIYMRFIYKSKIIIRAQKNYLLQNIKCYDLQMRIYMTNLLKNGIYKLNFLSIYKISHPSCF